jgi:hypothetical protein
MVVEGEGGGLGRRYMSSLGMMDEGNRIFMGAFYPYDVYTPSLCFMQQISPSQYKIMVL